ncbi:uncharacterized protein LOC131673607 [Phymastichus coffea]|uniref:uncharacterized protein LOC131673607 n=1 Tax=Phymastichus coffea TaxID=108790 RepID=UPI00273BEF6A|nr:uncharacterized protein LOC131673607 [Phymastichus coffea]
MFLQNTGSGYVSYSNLHTDSEKSSLNHSVPSYQEAVDQQFGSTTIDVSKVEAGSSQLDYISSNNEHPSTAVSQYCGPHQVHLMPTYNGTYSKHKEPNMCLMYIIATVVITSPVMVIVCYRSMF